MDDRERVKLLRAALEAAREHLRQHATCQACAHTWGQHHGHTVQVGYVGSVPIVLGEEPSHCSRADGCKRFVGSTAADKLFIGPIDAVLQATEPEPAPVLLGTCDWQQGELPKEGPHPKRINCINWRPLPRDPEAPAMQAQAHICPRCHDDHDSAIDCAEYARRQERK